MFCAKCCLCLLISSLLLNNGIHVILRSLLIEIIAIKLLRSSSWTDRSLWDIHFSNGIGYFAFYVDTPSLYHWQDFYRFWLYEQHDGCLIRNMYFSSTWNWPCFYDAVRVSHLLSFLSCGICLSFDFDLSEVIPKTSRVPYEWYIRLYLFHFLSQVYSPLKYEWLKVMFETRANLVRLQYFITIYL